MKANSQKQRCLALRHYVDNNILLVIYYSLVQSHLLYGILTFGSENTTTLKPLQTIQNKIVRLMCKVDRASHVTNNSLYKRLSILKIKDLCKVELAKFVHSYQRNRLPQIFQDCFQPVKTLPEICTLINFTYLHAQAINLNHQYISKESKFGTIYQ